MALKHVKADDDFVLANADLERHLKFIGTTGGKEPFVFIDGKADAQMIPSMQKFLKRLELTKGECVRRRVRFLPKQRCALSSPQTDYSDWKGGN
jgi:hypothetical protein